MTEPGGWTPDQKTIDDANLTRFITWLADTGRGACRLRALNSGL